jgi:putative ABC transport system permease protein
MSGRRRFWHLFGADPVRDVDDEIAFHLEMRIRERIAAGEDAEQARAAVLERFGSVAEAREECVTIDERMVRRMRRADYMSELRTDIAYALRSMRRQPGFALLAVLTLALGIGANSAIFSVVHGVLLQALPWRAADELMYVETEYSNATRFPLSAPDYVSVLDENRVFADVGALTQQIATMTGRGDAREVEATLVSRNLFAVLGMSPIAGRVFVPAEHVDGADDVAVLTESFARTMFGGVDQSLQQTITLQGRPFTIVGVMPSGTEAPEQAELYLPLAYDSSFSSATAFARRSEYLSVIARLRPGMTPARAEQDMKRLGAELEQRFPNSNDNITLSAKPFAEEMLGEVRRPLFALLGAVGLVLLVACANVANLLLARATAREGEFAVRAALGAGRGRLIRQLLTESTVLAGAGAVIGLLLAWWGTRALIAAQPAGMPRIDEIGIDRTVLLFTAAVALLTGLLFGTLPALQVTGGRMMQALRESGRGALSGIRGQHIRATLVIAELALAVVLLAGAGLLIRSFLHLTRVETGFDTTNAVAFRVALQGAKYDSAATRRQFFAQLEERLRAIPGVTDVGAATGLPMTGIAGLFGPFQVEGMDVPPNVLPEIRLITVTPEYFRALGTPLLKGRWLDSRDHAEAPRVALFNRAAIARWFPDGDPVGERVLLGNTPVEVVGVVGDVLQRSPDVPVEPEMYVPYQQRTGRMLRYVVRAEAGIGGVSAQIRREVKQLDADLALENIDPLQRVFNDAVARPRLYTTLLTLFAGVALTLAVIGIFGVMSYVVAQRAREISIRMALGADAKTVVAMVVAAAMKVATAGLILGLVAAFYFVRVLRSQLFGVDLLDPITIVSVVGVLAASAAVASFLPARRAARLQPGSALRAG